MTRNLTWRFLQAPAGFPKIGECMHLVSDTIDLEQTPPADSILVKVLGISVDPYLRGKMSGNVYLGSWKKDDVCDSFGVSQILKSTAPHLKEGQLIISGASPWSEYGVLSAKAVFRVVDPAWDLPVATYLGALGMPSRTAWYGLDVAKIKPGEKIFCSAASGAVGQIVCQLAKQAGLFVIGSAGSDEKVELLRNSFGCDEAFNYVTQSYADVLAKHAPIHVYFDNTQGPALDAFLLHGAVHSRIIACGQIAAGNAQADGKEYVTRNLAMIIGKRITMTGILVPDASQEQTDDFYNKMPKMIKDGQIKVKEDVTDGIEHVESVFYGMLRGKNVGKAVIQVAKL